MKTTEHFGNYPSRKRASLKPKKRAAALEEGFKKIHDAANAAAVNTGNNFVQLFQPMDAAKRRTADMNEALKQTTSTFQFAKSGVSAFAAAATVALGAVVSGAGLQ